MAKYNRQNGLSEAFCVLGIIKGFTLVGFRSFSWAFFVTESSYAFSHFSAFIHSLD